MYKANPFRLLIPVTIALFLTGCASDGTMKRWGQCALIGGGTGLVLGAIESATAAAGAGAAGALLGGLLCRSSKVDADNDGVDDRYDNCKDTPAGVEVDSLGCPIDSDGDGVPDYLDQCPDTPAGVRVNSEGCPIDSDRDGVTDDKDMCPNTPPGIPVDEKGCAVPRDLGKIMFDFDKDSLTDEGKVILDSVAEKMKQDDALKLKVFGYTDDTGIESYNQGLCTRRANTVRDYLISHGVKEDHVEALIGGVIKEHNNTRAGRAANRKAELVTSR